MNAIFIPALLIYICITSRLVSKLSGGDSMIHKIPCLFYLPMALPFLMFCIIPFPLPVFYFMVYIICCIPMIFIYHNKVRNWLFINLQFLFFVPLHLILLGIRAFLTETDVYSILMNPAFRMASLTAVAIINSIVNLILFKSIHKKFSDLIKQDSEVFQMFFAFTWFCVFFTLLDSIPCLFTLPATFPILFLIGSNILLLLLIILFANRTYVIALNSYLKNENLRLKEEEAIQKIRTKKLEQEAYIDPLTKAYTRRYALTNISSMLENKEDFILVFIDLDRLKQINDLHGHHAGDLYLQSFSAFIRSKLRPNDIFARYGGDEFLILMPDILKAASARQMETIRLEAKKTGFQGCCIPFSYGLTEVSSDSGLSAEDWIVKADRIMYEDKKLQRTLMEENQ